MAGEEGSARFQQYCEAHGLDPAECLAPVQRFVRVNRDVAPAGGLPPPQRC